MGFFLRKSWIWWVLAALLATLLTWLLNWWRHRGQGAGAGSDDAELRAARGLVDTHKARIAELEGQLAEHDKQLADTLRSFDQQWQGAMGGQDPSNNSEYQRQRMRIMQDAEAQWTANQSQFQFQYDQALQQQKMQAAQALSQLDDTQRQALLQLADLDIQSIMFQTGLEAGEAQQFKEMFSGLGQLMMQQSINNADPMRQAMTQYYQNMIPMRPGI